jgi:hypothetical protein
MDVFFYGIIAVSALLTAVAQFNKVEVLTKVSINVSGAEK